VGFRDAHHLAPGEYFMSVSSNATMREPSSSAFRGQLFKVIWVMETSTAVSSSCLWLILKSLKSKTRESGFSMPSRSRERCAKRRSCQWLWYAPFQPLAWPSMNATVVSIPDSKIIGARLDRLPAARYIWKLVILLSLGAFFEVYDIALTGSLSPGLIRAGVFHTGVKGLFGLTDQATFGAVTFLGLFIGTIGFASVADRYGRRAIFTFSLLWYAAFTVLMAMQNRAVMIDLWRFIASVGIGVELVTIDSYIAELVPKQIRGKAFAVNHCVQYLAVPAVALLSWLLIPTKPFGLEGWRWVALVPALGAIFVWGIRRAVPESPRWLLARGRVREAEKIIEQIESHVASEWGRPLPEPHLVRRKSATT
jgi:hypothetical protein